MRPNVDPAGPSVDIAAVARAWSARFLAHGVDPNDYDRITSSVVDWGDWLDAWERSGEAYAAIGEEALAAGHVRTAGEMLVRAGLHVHAGKFLWLEDRDRYAGAVTRSARLVARGMALLDPTFERLEVPFSGDRIVVNLRRPIGVARPPVVVLVPGLDSTKEELPAWEDVLLRRGLATASMDGPGQGEGGAVNALRPDYEVPVGAVLDRLAPRPDLAGSRVGISGIGLGDYFASRAIAFEPRLQAAAVVGGPYAFAMRPGLATMKFMASARIDDPTRAAELAAQFTMAGVAERIARPYLVIHGARCPIFRWEDARRKAEEAPGGRFVLYPEGGTVCYSEGPRVRALLADWLADRLQAGIPPSSHDPVQREETIDAG